MKLAEHFRSGRRRRAPVLPIAKADFLETAEAQDNNKMDVATKGGKEYSVSGNELASQNETALLQHMGGERVSEKTGKPKKKNKKNKKDTAKTKSWLLCENWERKDQSQFSFNFTVNEPEPCPPIEEKTVGTKRQEGQIEVASASEDNEVQRSDLKPEEDRGGEPMQGVEEKVNVKPNVDGSESSIEMPSPAENEIVLQQTSASAGAEDPGKTTEIDPSIFAPTNGKIVSGAQNHPPKGQEPAVTDEDIMKKKKTDKKKKNKKKKKAQYNTPEVCGDAEGIESSKLSTDISEPDAGTSGAEAAAKAFLHSLTSPSPRAPLLENNRAVTKTVAKAVEDEQNDQIADRKHALVRGPVAGGAGNPSELEAQQRKLRNRLLKQKKKESKARTKALGDTSFVKLVSSKPPRLSEVGKMRMRYGRKVRERKVDMERTEEAIVGQPGTSGGERETRAGTQKQEESVAGASETPVKQFSFGFAL